MRRDDVVAWLDDLLGIARVADYGPQGLQIEGRAEVARVVGLVDAIGAPCVQAAIDHRADLVLVHHGLLWGAAQPLVGALGRQVRRYLEADLSLYAAHLALDAHPEVGNNAQVAARLGLKVTAWWGDARGTPICCTAEASPPTTLEVLVADVAQHLGPPARVQPHGPREVRRVGICTGGGAAFIAEAAARGCDTFLTGETSHAHYWDAEGAGINVVWAGHYASETLGVQALGQRMARELGVDFAFVDVPTGM